MAVVAVMREHGSLENLLANQYLYRLEPVRLGTLTQGPTEHEAAIIGDHFAYLERLASRGIVLMAGRTLAADENTFGIEALEKCNKRTVM